MKQFIKSSNLFLSIFHFIMITLGCVLAAVSLETFLVPNLIIDGGITGISIMVSQLTKLPLGLFVFLLNLPFIFLGLKQIGKIFVIKTSYAMICFSLLLSLLHHVPEVTNDMLLCTIFGGILLGAGAGIVIRYGGCLDGTETIAILISKHTSLSVGQIVLICNLLIFGTSGFLFGWDRALYSLLTYFIAFKIIDMVVEGFEQAKSAMIITNQGKEISEDIFNKLGRTVTIMEGKGLISGEKVILYSVITRLEVYALKKIVQEDDRSAFVTISDISEVIGTPVKN